MGDLCNKERKVWERGGWIAGDIENFKFLQEEDHTLLHLFFVFYLISTIILL